MIFIVSACNAETTSVEFSGLIIPKKYVLQAPENNSKGVYDDEEIPIGLVIDEEDVKRNIPEYQIAARGSRKLSLVVYQGPVDIKGISDSVLSGYSSDKVRFGPDKYSQNKRYYRSADNWLLVSDDNGQRLLVAQCSRTGIFGNVVGCDFKKNINGYGISYHLENSNITLTKKFDEFIASKIESWKEASK